MRLWLARTVAVRSPAWLYRRLPQRLKWWAADVRLTGYLERGSW